MTADETTRRALRDALINSQSSQRSWARRHGLPHGTVNDCLLRKPMSARRENRLREALGLPVIDTDTATVVIHPQTERVVKRPGYGRKRGYVEFKIRVSEEEAQSIRAFLKEAKYESFNEWWRDFGGVERIMWGD